MHIGDDKKHVDVEFYRYDVASIILVFWKIFVDTTFLSNYIFTFMAINMAFSSIYRFINGGQMSRRLSKLFLLITYCF